MIRKSALLVLLIVTNSWVTAKPLPLSQRLQLVPLATNAKLQLPEIDPAALSAASKHKLSAINGKTIVRPLKISETHWINQSLHDIGQWQTVNGQSVWRFHISSKDALHLNLGFKKLHLPQSARLFISDARNGRVLKVYSSTDNKFHGELWTPLLESNELLIELNIDTAELDQLRLQLLQAGQGFKAIKPSQYKAASAPCNIDVACPQADGWQDDIRAVARYTISDNKGTYLCTGTLINNTRQDLAPLFLTAAHCLVSDITAASMVFYWNYETSVCGGIPDGSLEQNQNGASLVSRWEGTGTHSDFALVRLDSVPDSNFNVYYAGWNVSDQIYTGARGIHHPSGKEKSLSIDNDQLTITEFGTNDPSADAHYLRVDHWDEGTTEGGSSGSSLWNLNHQIIGTLTGGDASCDSLIGSDWYGRMASHWLGNSFKTNQLAAHLAPDLSTTTSLSGKTSCAAPVVTISSSTASPLAGEQFSLTSEVSGGSGNIRYEWDFDADGQPDSNLANPIHTFYQPGNYRIRLLVRDNNQCPGSDEYSLLVADSAERFIADGKLPEGFIKPTTAEGSWIADDSQASEGIFSLKSQIINGDNSSAIEISGVYQQGVISFDRRVSSEQDFDSFRFFIDDIEKFSISGEQSWSRVSYPITTGEHRFRWVFEKDASVSNGQDAAWIDDLELPEAATTGIPEVVSPIADQTSQSGDMVTLNVAGNFSDPDGDNLTFIMLGGPASLSIDSVTGQISGTLKALDVRNSPYDVEVIASDGVYDISAGFSWTVKAAPAKSSGGGSAGVALLMLLLFARSLTRRT